MNITVEIEIFPDGRLDTTNAGKYLKKSQKTLAMCAVWGPDRSLSSEGGFFISRKTSIPGFCKMGNDPAPQKVDKLPANTHRTK